MVNVCRLQTSESANKAVDGFVGFLWKCGFPVEPLLKTNGQTIPQIQRGAIREDLIRCGGDMVTHLGLMALISDTPGVENNSFSRFASIQYITSRRGVENR
jgi:hypothetical protein